MVKQSIEPFTLDNNIIRFVDILSYTYMLIYISISIYGIDGEEEEKKEKKTWALAWSSSGGGESVALASHRHPLERFPPAS